MFTFLFCRSVWTRTPVTCRSLGIAVIGSSTGRLVGPITLNPSSSPGARARLAKCEPVDGTHRVRVPAAPSVMPLKVQRLNPKTCFSVLYLMDSGTR